MDDLSIIVNTRYGNYRVYRSREHFTKRYHASLIVPLLGATIGTFLDTNKGYIVPVCKRQGVHLYVPMMHIDLRDAKDFLVDDKLWYPYSFEEQFDKRFGYLSNEEKMFVRLVAQGIPIKRAQKVVFGTIKRNIFARELLLEYLAKVLNMSLKDKLIERGADEDFIAEQLVQMAGSIDPRMTTQRIYALEKIDKTINVEVQQGTVTDVSKQLAGNATFTKPTLSPNHSEASPRNENASPSVEEVSYTFDE